jgi:CRISPR-associated endonuclease/helicase Cas3
MAMTDFYAHTSDERAWERLEDHLDDVAKLAGEFAGQFGAGEWGRLAGRWHDLGKYSDEFQAYLKASSEADAHADELRGKVDHSSAGAQWAKEQHPALGMVLAHVIAGHHAGLLDYAREAGAACLKSRITKDIPAWRDNAFNEVLAAELPGAPALGNADGHQHAAFKVAFWIRMLFSALVDADFLATEAFMNLEKASLRPSRAHSLTTLQRVLDKRLNDITSKAENTNVNKHRARVLAACRERAGDSPGFFELCVPTGGGKTLSSLAFALGHATAHDLRRVVIAVPFTSIIEQNAQTYRDALNALGDDVVLEHHSNLDPMNETARNRLQAENWDAPLVVTTNVQFFESLFARRTSRCRKLHRLAKSVIVLDEVQTLPADLLKPTLWALRELVDVYGCSVVLCTATQPAISLRDDFPIGLDGIRPIIEQAGELYQVMRRVHVAVEDRIEDEELSMRLLKHEQVLCILNTKGRTARVSAMLGDAEGHYHLSTRMCGAHRLFVIKEIAQRLRDRKTCRVVSTQLVEAGVDLDFPVVYRARCGLDSLAQAAGRCNREGTCERGEVVFFAAAEPPPVGPLRQTAQKAEELIEQYRDDPLAPEAIEAYFKLHYWSCESRWDHRKVLDSVGNNPGTMHFQFREMADRYRFIPDDEGDDLLVPWGREGRALVEVLRRPCPPDRKVWRSLQRYCVHVRSRELDKLKNAGSVSSLHERWVLTDPNSYDERLGLVFDRRLTAEESVV